ncbi:uncharacterized protein [Heliangelus exortis]|uniref:uncharacterized protein n=1 Tax=Heliangelus exortis TaxID=472823 RepID=UPI003A955F86
MDTTLLTQLGWLLLIWASGLLLFLAVWAERQCWCKHSSKQHQVTPCSLWRCLAEAHDLGKKAALHGCEVEICDGQGRALGRFLCHDLSCVPCKKFIQKRRQHLREAQQNPKSTQHPSCPPLRRCRRLGGQGKRRKLLAQHRDQAHVLAEAPGPLHQATADSEIQLGSQAEELTEPLPSELERDVGYRASAAAATYPPPRANPWLSDDEPSE